MAKNNCWDLWTYLVRYIYICFPCALYKLNGKRGNDQKGINILQAGLYGGWLPNKTQQSAFEPAKYFSRGRRVSAWTTGYASTGTADHATERVAHWNVEIVRGGHRKSRCHHIRKVCCTFVQILKFMLDSILSWIKLS